MKNAVIRRVCAAAAVFAMTVAGLTIVGAPAQALSGSDFQAGNIISDQVFFNAAAMSQANIQTFLQARESGCTASNGLPCLKDYSQATSSRAASAGHCAAYAGASSESASQIIYKVSQACGINAQVLLVLIEKEQGLVTSTAPTAYKYQAATGYGCPDSSGCDSQYYGFYNQVYRAAWQFREYTSNPGDWRYRIGNTAILYNPNSSCGSGVVNIQNQATANLYNYTPYQPNAAALANLNGVGDSCSSYGNRNFWVFFNNWFGTSTGANPIGNVELVSAQPGKFRVVGWALDQDTNAPIDVHVYVGAVGEAFTANLARADVAAAYGRGDKHGFDVLIPAQGAGTPSICVYGMNYGPGANVLFGCTSAAAMSGPPIGALDSATVGSDGAIAVKGWAIDPDVVDPIRVDVYVDAVGKALTANTSRTDIAAAHPPYGDKHGFDDTFSASPGVHQVCAYGIDVRPGGNVLLGCKSVTVPGSAPLPDLGRPPFGNVEAIDPVTGGVSVAGWALDPDTASPIHVDVYVDSSGVRYTADGSRSDVAAAYPAYGAGHGFSQTIAASAGAHRVCAYAINNGAGGNVLLGCKSVTVQ